MTFFGIFLKPDSVFWSIFYIFFIYFQTAIDGARKVRFERMTPIRKGGENTKVTVSGHGPGNDGFKIAKKRSLGPQNFS